MAVRYFTGWETGDTAATNSETVAMSSTGAGTCALSTEQAHHGTYSLKVTAPTTATAYAYVQPLATAGALAYATANLASAYLAFDLWVAEAPSATSEPFTSLYDGGAQVVELRLTSARTIALYQATTLVATGTTVLALDTWYRIDWRVLTGASATVQVRVNGTVEPNLDDVSVTAASDIDRAYVGKVTNRNSQSLTAYYDNLILEDAAYPATDAVVTPLWPVADGALGTAWTASDGGSLDWEHLTSVTDGRFLASTNVLNDTSAVTFQSCAVGGVTGTLLGVMYRVMIARHTGDATASCAARFVAGASDTTSGTTTTSTGNWGRTYAVHPATGVAWTTSEVDAVQLALLEKSTTASTRTDWKAAAILVLHRPAAVTDRVVRRPGFVNTPRLSVARRTV